MEAVDLPECLSLDEQSMGFHGRSSNKMRIKFKKVGDGFQADCICSDGYTFSFYFRYQPPPKKYVEQGISPLHSRCLFLMDQLAEKRHCIFMDNLYMSAYFALLCQQSTNNVKIHGVTRLDKKGIPSCVLQDVVQNKELASKVKGTVKVAVLHGEDRCRDLLAISYYDSKPVYFISNVMKKVRFSKFFTSFNYDLQTIYLIGDMGCK